MLLAKVALSGLCLHVDRSPEDLAVAFIRCLVSLRNSQTAICNSSTFALFHSLNDFIAFRYVFLVCVD